MMIEVATEITATDGQIRVTWITNHQNSMRYEVWKKLGDEESLVTELQSDQKKNFITDNSVTLGNRDQRYFYKIKAFFLNGNLKEESEYTSLEGDYRVFELHIMKMQNYYFKHQAGTPFFLYQRKLLETVHCPICWDVALNKVRTRSLEGCSLCLGTGIIDPFYPARLIFASQTNPDQLNQSADDIFRIKNFDEGQLYVNGLPLIKDGDLLMYNKKNDFYQVDTVARVGRPDAPVLQILKVKQTPMMKDEYKFIEQDSETRETLLEEFRKINKERRW